MDLLSALYQSEYTSCYVAGQANCQQANYASQIFQKRLSAIDYTLQWQSLHREDIRDLMQLTAGRMDIYHVVGTLLLTFCFEWYTSNTLLQDEKLPFGFVLLFLITNFCALSYLLFSVWLAMHASIASQSIGTRLLTSFARLSIPSKEELDRIHVSMIPLLDKLMLLGKTVYDKVRTAYMEPEKFASQSSRSSRDKKAKDSAETQSFSSTSKPERQPCYASSDNACDDDGLAHEHGKTFENDIRRSHEIAGMIASENCNVDQRRHFLRYLQEQQRWLGYDAYARACMSLGVNQLLQSLGYYLLGTFSHFSRVHAVMSFLGFQLLALFLMQLDITDIFVDNRERSAAILFFILPPLLAAVVEWTTRLLSLEMRNLVILPCFVLHCIGTLCIASQVKPVPPADSAGAGNPAWLPRRWRAVSYLNVIDVRQRKLALDVLAKDAQEQVYILKRARDVLLASMKTTMSDELACGFVSPSCRTSDILQQHFNLLEKCLEAARLSRMACDRKVMQETTQCEYTLEYCALWQQAPMLLASFDALRSSPVKPWLEDDQKRQLEESFAYFLHTCKDLNLGCTTFVQASNNIQSRGLPMLPLRIPPDEKKIVQMNTYCDSFPHTVWIDTHKDKILSDEPAEGQWTSLTSFEENILPGWKAQVLRLNLRQEALKHHSFTAISTSSVDSLTDECLVHSPTSPTALFPPDSLPPDQLPGMVVHRFTMFAAFFWFTAGVLQAITCIHGMHRSDILMDMTVVQVEWPAPANLFEPTALHCNATHLTVSNGFATHRSERDKYRTGKFSKLVDSTASAFVCTGEHGCNQVLVYSSNQSRGSIQGFLDESIEIESVAFPQTLLIVSGVHFLNCNEHECESAMAGWDGSNIIIGKLVKRLGSTHEASKNKGRWKFKAHIAVRPALAKCSKASLNSGCEDAANGNPRYNDVKAIHISDDGHALLALFGDGFLDAWNLQSGELVGRWKLAASPTGGLHSLMCMAGSELLVLASSVPGQAGGPELFSATLPNELLSLFGQCNDAASSEQDNSISLDEKVVI